LVNKVGRGPEVLVAVADDDVVDGGGVEDGTAEDELAAG